MSSQTHLAYRHNHMPILVAQGNTSKETLMKRIRGFIRERYSENVVCGWLQNLSLALRNLGDRSGRIYVGEVDLTAIPAKICQLVRYRDCAVRCRCGVACVTRVSSVLRCFGFCFDDSSGLGAACLAQLPALTTDISWRHPTIHEARVQCIC